MVMQLQSERPSAARLDETIPIDEDPPLILHQVVIKLKAKKKKGEDDEDD